jgi:MFS family permease
MVGNMKKILCKLKWKPLLLLILLPTVFGVTVSSNAYATVVDSDHLQKLAILQGVKKCYKSYAKDSLYLRDFSKIDNIFTSSWNSNDGDVVIPTKVGNSINDSDLKCQELFYGYPNEDHGKTKYGTSNGFNSYYSFPTDLTKLGYRFDHTDGVNNPDSAKRTVTFSVEDQDGNLIPTQVTGNLTVSGTKYKVNGWFGSSHYEWDMRTIGTVMFTYDNHIVFSIEYQEDGGSYNTVPFLGYYDTTQVGMLSYPGYGDSTVLTEASNGNNSNQQTESFDEALGVLTGYLKQDIQEVFTRMGIYTNPKITITTEDAMPTVQEPSNPDSLYARISSGSTTGEVMLAELGTLDVPVINGEASGGDGKYYKTVTPYWNKDYEYSLYYHYLQRMISEHGGIQVGPCGSSVPSGAKYAFKSTKDKWCAISITPNVENEVLNEAVAIKGDVYLEMATFANVLTWFGNESSYNGMSDDKYADVDVAEPTVPDPIPGTEDDDPTIDPESSEEEKCYENAKSLGWIICPVIFGLRDMTDNIYNAIEPWIQTNSSVVKQLGSTDSGLFQAWAVFRNIANVIFVIFFMIIVFSQLTGYGIDNYGIKRMLPKLITTVILVNLSFIICALLVDASNIIGSSIKGLLETIAKTAGASGSGILGGNSVSAVGATVQRIVGWVVAGGTVLGVAAATVYFQGWAIIIPVLLFLLTVAIAAFFALVVLGLRQALVVALVVASPLALVCTLLPNTEGIYKKWFNAFKGILMVYPIIGAVIGAGYLTACIIMSAEAGFTMTLISGVLMVAPYFMIPSLTRKAIDAVGNLGSRVGNMGHNLSGRARNGINNSNAVKNARSDWTASRAQARAQRYMNSKSAQKVQDDIKNGKKVSMRRANRYQRNATLANSRSQANIGARAAESQYNRLHSDSGYSAAMSAAQMAEDETEIKNYETLVANSDYRYDGGPADGVDFQSTNQIKDALEYELLHGGDKNRMRALQNVLNRKGDKGRNAIYEAMRDAQSKGEVSKDMVKAFSSNIMNNQGDYKGSHRSLYEYAKNTAETGVAPHEEGIEAYAAKGVMSLTQSSFLSTDKTQMDAYLKAYTNEDGKSTMDDEEREHLRQLAHGIANNENVHGSIRVDDYGTALQAFAPDVKWDNVFSGQSLTVDHSAAGSSANHDAALGAFQDRLNRKVTDGTYTQSEADDLLAKAKAHFYDKDKGNK